MRGFVQAALLAGMVMAAPNAFAEPPSRMITVVTPGWTATTGELRRWQRDGKTWRQVGAATAVVVGRAGMKWADDKREGDGASPAGSFNIGDATGYERVATRLRFRVADASLRCVDDTKSPAYNTVTVADVGERMRRDDELYRYTIFVRHNVARTPGLGSCICLHVWRDARSPTVGCTAMALDDMRALLQWVDSSTELVQLPRAEYDKRQRRWALPPLAQRK